MHEINTQQVRTEKLIIGNRRKWRENTRMRCNTRKKVSENKKTGKKGVELVNGKLEQSKQKQDKGK